MRINPDLSNKLMDNLSLGFGEELGLKPSFNAKVGAAHA